MNERDKLMPEITYTQVGDYYLPNIILSDPPDAEPLTKYGIMRKHYLKHYRPLVYGKMLACEEVYPHCRDIQHQAQERMDILMEQLTKRNPPPNKATDGLAWAAHMGMLQQTAEEIVQYELIYS